MTKTRRSTSHHARGLAPKRKPERLVGEANTSAVGYRKPPLKSQFKKGQSGNPRGRPKKSKNLRTIIQDALLTKITVREGEKTRIVSKLEALVLRHIDSALKGNDRAALITLKMAEHVGLIAKSKSSSELPELSAAENAIMTDFIARLGIKEPKN